MKPDIQSRLKKDFGAAFYEAIEEINIWDAQTKGLLGDRLLRATIYLANGSIEEFRRIKEAGRLGFEEVIRQAEYDGKEERVRDFNRQFGSESKKPIEQ